MQTQLKGGHKGTLRLRSLAPSSGKRNGESGGTQAHYLESNFLPSSKVPL